MADEKTNMNDIASEQAGSIPAVTGIDVPTGLSGSDPAVQSKINDIMKLRAGDYGRSAVMGAAAGAQAGQGAGSPLNAFIQGMAAGLQAPAQIYQAKKAQVQSVLDATPFSATHPEIAKQPGYNILASLPTKIALQAISQIAQDGAKVARESEARMAEEKYKKILEGMSPKIDYKSEQDMAADFNKLPEVAEYKAVKSAHNQIATAQLKIWDDKSKTYLPNPAGQLAVVSGYIKLLNPQARFTEGTLSAADVGSDVDKYTIDLYNRIKNGDVAGEDEVKRIQGAARAKYKEVTRNYRKIADIWADKADERGLDSNFVLSGDTGSGESIDDVYKTIAAQHPGMSKMEVFAIMKSQGY